MTVTPRAAMASMLGLVDLGHQLACVRPLHETPSDFDEAAFQHLRRNFELLVHCYNELSELTGQGPLHIESSPPSGANNRLAAP